MAMAPIWAKRPVGEAGGRERLPLAGPIVLCPPLPQRGADRKPFNTPLIGPAAGDGGQVQVLVRDNNVDQALKALKKKMQREGVFREMKLRRHYEKPSERRAREAAEAVRRARKMERKRLEREGF
jgi:small subunit ribosomal protein S21